MSPETPRKKKTLGRGMGDLIGDTLENLVRGSEPPPPRDEERTSRLEEEPVLAPSRMAAPGNEAAAPHVARAIAVASGKGGTGKSLIAVNLAVALAENHRVGLIDLDLGLANAHILLGLLPRYDVSHLLSGERSLDEVVLTGPRGLVVLPGASGLPELAALDDPSLDRLSSLLEPLTHRSEFLLLDCPAGLSRQSLLFLHGADVILVVTTDDLTSMTDAYALIKTVVTHRPHASVGLLVNDSRSLMEGADTYRKISHVARKFLGREILSMGTIPRDVYLERSVQERRPVVTAHPTSPSARAILELARRLAAHESIEPVLTFPERVSRVLAAAARSGVARPEESCAS